MGRSPPHFFGGAVWPCTATIRLVSTPQLDIMNYHLLGGIAIGLLATPLTAAPTAVVTLNSIGDRVRSQNPDLAAARLGIDEAIGRMKNSGRLDNPNIQISPRYNTTTAERGIELNLSQRFPLTNRLSLEKHLGATEVESARQEVREVENQLIGEARTAFVRVLAIRQRQDLLKQQSKLANDFADFLAGSAKRGESSSLNAGQARLEIARIMTESRRLSAEEYQIIGSLQSLIGMKPGDPLAISGMLPGLALPGEVRADNRPALEVARLAVIAAEQNAAMERARRCGDLTTGMMAGIERNLDEPAGAANEGIIGIQFSMPLPFWNKNEGNIEAAEAGRKRRHKEALAMERTILLEAEAARKEMIEWAKLVTEIESQLLPQASGQTKLAEQSWRAGQAELIDVFRSREQACSLAATRIEALQNFHLARIRFETALGNN